MPLEPLEQLRPIAKPRVMDLVEEAGIDVISWAFKADGTPVEIPAANPAHCYEWCFRDDKGVVFSLWFEEMLLEDVRVVQRLNARELRRRIERAKHLDAGTQMAHVRRAMAFDSAMLRAFQDKLSVRVNECDGDRRDIDDVASRDSSKVERRLLDPSPWQVTAYDLTSGGALLVRDQALL